MKEWYRNNSKEAGSSKFVDCFFGRGQIIRFRFALVIHCTKFALDIHDWNIENPNNIAGAFKMKILKLSERNNMDIILSV